MYLAVIWSVEATSSLGGPRVGEARRLNSKFICAHPVAQGYEMQERTKSKF